MRNPEYDGWMGPKGEWYPNGAMNGKQIRILRLARQLPTVPDSVWSEHPDNGYVADFSSGPNHYTSRLEHTSGDHYIYSFRQHRLDPRDDKEYGITGAGHATRTMSTVAAHVISALKQFKPKSISFSAEEPSRRKLYEWMGNKLERFAPEYEFQKNPNHPNIYHLREKDSSYRESPDELAKAYREGQEARRSPDIDETPSYSGNQRLQQEFQRGYRDQHRSMTINLSSRDFLHSDIDPMTGPEGWITPEGTYHANEPGPYGLRHDDTRARLGFKSHGEAVNAGLMHVKELGGQLLGHHPELRYTAAGLRKLKSLAAEHKLEPAITSKSNGTYTTRSLKLARIDLPRDAFVQKTLTNSQIADIENAHGLKPHERLARSVNPDGTVSANVEDIRKFFDAIGRKQLTPKQRKTFLDSSASDDAKFIHLLTHTHKTAEDYLSVLGHKGDEWYGSSVDALDRGAKKYFGREKPGDLTSKAKPSAWTPDHGKLFKMLLALTSYNTSPVGNVKNAAKALVAGYRHNPDRPFENIPDADHEALARYSHLPHPGTGHEGRLAFHEQHGENPGYKTAPIRIAKDTGKVVGIQNLDGTTRWTTPGYTRENTRPGILPLVDEEGKLLPKTWGTMGVDRVRKFKEFVRKAGSYKAATKILDSEHTPSELKKLFDLKTINRGDLDKNEKIPGSFAFGPKFGAFYRNLSGDKNRVTMDKWFSRTMNRLVAGLHGGGEAPKGPGERGLWKKVAEHAAAKLNLSPADFQAVLWYYEQNLWRLFGSGSRSEDFKDGIERLLKLNRSRIPGMGEIYAALRDSAATLKLDRTKAPSGGMIVNNQFYQGGKFLPRAFEAIRKVRAKKGKLNLSRY